MNFAIIGASGNVGRKTIEILEKSKIPFEELYLLQKKVLEKKLNFEKKKSLLKV
jgi:aspartate-semialdehyde dehydrogenase